MAIIKYNENELVQIQQKIHETNNEILENIRIIEKEINEIDEILNTPNSSKIIPEYMDDLNKIEKYIERQDDYFEKCFDIVRREYTGLLNDIGIIVGDNNE